MKNEVFAGLSFATALLAFGINELTGTWPSEVGHWGSVLFALLGIAVVGKTLVLRRQVDSDAVES